MPQTIHAPDWQLVSPKAPWRERDSQGEVVFQDHMWLLGGWYTPHEPNPRDVWKSRDGKDWTCVVEQAPWVHSDIPVALVFKDRIWLMGGRKLPGAENSNKVWSSPNGADWTLEGEAGWCPRLSMGHVVFKNKMWVFGGTEDFYHDNDDTLHHDVWCTDDGRDWTCVTENAGWSKRAHHQYLVYDDKIWLFGGGARLPDPHPLSDVWCSEDGEHWTQVTDDAPWGPRLWASAFVYRGRMWILGGWGGEETDNYGDVWCSTNGKDWTQVKSDKIWSPRHEQGGVVLNDTIYVFAGHARPTNSEVWSLHLPADFFLKNGSP
jgi:hypothetical protein